MIVLVAHLLLSVATGGWPLQPPPSVVEGFDPPADAWEAGHRGVDLLGSPGQPVRSALSGTVSFAGVISGRGVVVVDHGARRTTYEPVEASVHRGDEVAAGDLLGTLRWFGGHCLPRVCLHWGLIEGDHRYRDPLTLVGCGPRPVRLLPLESWVERASDECGHATPLGSEGPAPLAPDAAQARGCACRYAWRSRSLVMWV